MNANAKNEEKYNLTRHHVNPAARISRGGIASMQKTPMYVPTPPAQVISYAAHTTD